MLLLAGCAHSGGPPNRPKAEKPAPRPPAAPIDWLPADSFALLQLDVDQVRFVLPMPLLAAKLRPELHTLLERTHTVIVAVRSDGPEAELAGIFVGDYDRLIGPLLLAGSPQQQSGGPDHELWATAEDVWLHSPEGYWVVGEASVAEQLLVSPERRPQRLSQQAWTAAPEGPYLASAALHVSPPLRAALRERAQRESRAVLAEIGPALFELDDVRMTLRREGDGLRFFADLRFQSELGAQSGGLVLRGVLAVLGARVDPESDLQGALDGTTITVTGTRLHAEVGLDGKQLAALGTLLEQLTSEEEPAAVAAPAPQYQLPSAEQLAERERQARADERFAKVLDRVLEQAGPDLELRDARDPRTGKPGKPFLLVRVERRAAQVKRSQLAEALRADGLLVVEVARGFEGRPAELGVFQAKDQPAVLIARGTGEAHAQGTSKQLAALLRKWQRAAGEPRLAVADLDYVAFEWTAVPADPERTVQELLALCPEANAEQQQRQLLERKLLDCFLP